LRQSHSNTEKVTEVIVFQRVQTITNVAILIVALAIIAVLVNRYLYTFLPTRNARIPVTNTVHVGSQLNVTGIDWSKNKLTLVLVLSKNCRYCGDSAPFYQRLVREVRKLEDVRIMVMMPKSTDNPEQFLTSLDLEVDEIKQPAQKEIGVKSTPTLLLVNKAGVVLATWFGKLNEEQEDEVIEQVQTTLTNID
jgi:thioredoxin-related protein